MTVKLNSRGYQHALALIAAGKVDKTSSWSIDAEDENKMLGDPPDYPGYSKMFLGKDDAENDNTKAAYKYPIGKDGKVFRSALIGNRQRSAQNGADDVFDAAGRLIAKIDGEKSQGSATFEIRAAGTDITEVLIYGDIGESWDSASVSALDFVQNLAGIGTPKILVRINSFGGSVADGLAIVNAMKSHQAEITAQVDGVAVSAASLIAMGADNVLMAPNSLMMVHAPWGAAMGNAQELRAYADLLDTFGVAMAQDYAAKTGLSPDQIIKNYLDGSDHWLTAEEAVQQGFADGLTQSATGDAAAKLEPFKQSRFMARVPTRIAASLRNPEPTPIVQPESSTKEKTIMFEKPEDAAKDPKVIELVAAKDKLRREGIKNALKPYMDREGITALYTEALENADMTVEAVQAKCMEILGKGTQPGNNGTAGTIVGGEAERDKRVEAMALAIFDRSGKNKDPKQRVDGSNPFRGRSLLAIGEECLVSAGVNTRGKTRMEIANLLCGRGAGDVRAALTTSDFPVVLENTLHKMILTGMAAIQPTYQKFCKIGTVSDFRAWKRIVPGLIGNLDTVNEDGEYKLKALPDGTSNSLQATRKGNIISITPEVLVNDDLGYVTDMATGLGMAGPRTVERAVYAVLNANAVLSDGVALFAAGHNNKAAAGAAPSVATLDAARVAMSKQVAPGDDAEFLDIVPAIAVCEASVEGTMRAIIGSQYDPTAGAGQQRENIVRNLVGTIVGTPRLTTAGAWYLFADPAIAPVIEVGFLDGNQEPLVIQEPHFESGGLRWRIELPFGVAGIDYRGGYYNAGS